MASRFYCKSSVFNPFLVKDYLIYNEDSDVNLFQDIPSFDTKYYFTAEVKQSVRNFFYDTVSISHVNIRIMKKNFLNLRNLCHPLDFRFSLICFSETWTDDSFGKNSLYELKNYNVMHKIRNGCKGGGLCIFVYESLCYNIPKELCTNNYGIETFIWWPRSTIAKVKNKNKKEKKKNQKPKGKQKQKQKQN